MSQFNKLLADFKLGEVSPKYYGRKNLEEYGQAGELFDNFIPIIEGGFTRRVGEEYIDEIDSDLIDNNGGPALIPFVSTKEEGYIVVINPAGVVASTTPYIQIYKNDGTSCTVSPFLDVEAPAATLDPKGYHFAQIGDVLWITHNSGQLRPLLILRRSISTDDFAVLDYSLELTVAVDNNNLSRVSTVLKQPYRNVNISPITMTPSATTGSINITASAAFWESGHVNTLIRIYHSGSPSVEGVARISGITSTTVATAEVIIDFIATTASDVWREGSWSVKRGYPRSVTVHRDRLAWGGNKSEPDTIWFSKLGNPFVMMQEMLEQDLGSDSSGINYYYNSSIVDEAKRYDPRNEDKSGGARLIIESNAFSVSIGSKQANPISWLASNGNFSAGTLGGEYVAVGSIGPSLDFSFNLKTGYGSGPINPITMSSEILHVTREGHKIRGFKYNESNGTYVSPNLTVTADHMRRIGENIFSGYLSNYEFLQLAWQPSAEILWAINSSNQLVGMRYSKENGNISWFRANFGGTVLGVWGVCCTPNQNGGEDDVWVVIQRTVDSSTVWHLGRMGVSFEGEDMDPDDDTYEGDIPRFLDSYVLIDNTGTTLTDTVSGLSHLEGETVKFIYRGEDLGDYTVSSGSITLSAAAQLKVDTAGIGIVGLDYTSTFRGLDPEAGGDLGFSEGHIQAIYRVYMRVYKTRSLSCGGVNRTTPVKLGLESTSPELLANKIVKHEPNINPNMDARVVITASGGIPCTVTSLALRGSTDD